MKLFNRIRALWKPETPPVPKDERGLNEDWAAGDSALCLADGWCRASPNDPKKGDILTVSNIFDGVSTSGEKFVTALGFEGKPQNIGWHCNAFKKLRPIEIEALAKKAAKRNKQKENT